MGACTLELHVPRCDLRHLARRTAGKCSSEGEGLLLGLNSACAALGEAQEEGRAGGGVHLKVLHGALGAKCFNLAQERIQRELEGGGERGS